MKPRHEQLTPLPTPRSATSSRITSSSVVRTSAFIAVAVIGAVVMAAALQLRTTQAAQTDPSVAPGVPRVGSSGQKSAASSSKAGSVLFFHKFTSDGIKSSNVNTLLTLTNTNPRDGVALHLIFVANCASDDQFISLGPNQTRTLLMSKEKPGQTGYAIAVAVNSEGVPTQFNWLIGSASLRDVHAHEAGYNALAVAKRTAGAVHLSNGGSYGSLNFDGLEYDRLPKKIALDNIQNQAARKVGSLSTDAVVYVPSSKPDADDYEATKITAVAYDQNGKAYPEVADNICGLSLSLRNLWSDTPITDIVTEGKPGWASFSAVNANSEAVPVLGLSLTESLSGEAQHNARNMQVLEWLDKYKITIPIGFVSEPPADSPSQDQPEATGNSEGASESKAGSVLIYPRYLTSDGGNTHINLTNANASQKIRVRLFFSNVVVASQITDKIVSLAPNQTTTIDVAGMAANQRGWVLAVAIDAGGRPTSFNFLIGSAQVTEGAATGEASAAYNALAIAKNSPGPVERNEDATSADLVFDDLNYDRLPATAAMNAVASQDDTTTTLGFSRPPITLLNGGNTRGSISATLYDDAFNSSGTTIGKTETRLSTLKSIGGSQSFTAIIGKGHRGWLKMNSATPLFTWANTQANAPFAASGNVWSGGLSGGGDLHYLTVSDFAHIIAPASNPNNHTPLASAEPLGRFIEARRASGTIVRLDGSASSDEDPEDVLTYQWTDADKLVADSRVTDLRLGLGLHGIDLTVTDASGATSIPDEQIVEVRDTLAPQLSGIPSGIIRTTAALAGGTVNFKLPMAYDMVDGWVQVTASRAPGSVFPLGETTVTFTAKDKAGNSSTAFMQVNVVLDGKESQTGGAVGSIQPVMENLNDQYLPAGTTRDIVLKATDLDNDPVTFSLIGAAPNAQIVDVDSAARKATLRIKASDKDPQAELRISVTDNRRQTFRTLPFRVIVSDIPNDETGSGIKLSNRAPVPIVEPLPSATQATSKDGLEIELDGSKSRDADGDALTYTWTDDGKVIAQGAKATVKLAVGLHSIVLIVSDGNGGTTSSSVNRIEVLPRSLGITSLNPNRLARNITTTFTINGAGIVPGTRVLFGKTGVNVLSYLRVDEDQIVLTVRVENDVIPGSCDVYLVTPAGKSIRFRSGLYITP